MVSAKVKEAQQLVKSVGKAVMGQPLCQLEEGVNFVHEKELEQLYLNTVWRSVLTI